MKTLIIYVALLAGQMSSPQDRHVVYLPAHQDSIPLQFGGDLLVLSDVPAVIYLPTSPPKQDARGNPWSLDIKNVGPGVVRVVGKAPFSFHINVGQTVHILWMGSEYVFRR